VCCLVRCGCGGCLVRVGGKVLRAHGGAAAGWCAWCRVVISATIGRRWCFLSRFRYPSLWQRSEAKDVVRPPRRVARIDAFHLRCDESFLPKQRRSREIDDRVCASWWLPMEFWWPLRFAAGCGFDRGTSLGTTARVEAASLTFLPGSGGVVFCCLCCSCALFVCDDVSLSS
jgi:hypothetical protein